MAAPTYKVKMVSFRAADESGRDWLGSDEAYWVVSSVGADGTAKTFRTRTFGDVDSGETRTFGVTEGCIFSTTCGAATAPDGIGLSIQLLEEDDDDAAAIANDIPYGLAAGVWTQSIRRALRMSERLRAGTVWVNTYRAVSYMSPFGGYNRPGLGRENGMDAINEYLQTKSVWISTAEEVPNPFVMR
jgi:hypothetical protein